jgi:hypothetical protein
VKCATADGERAGQAFELKGYMRSSAMKRGVCFHAVKRLFDRLLLAEIGHGRGHGGICRVDKVSEVALKPVVSRLQFRLWEAAALGGTLKWEKCQQWARRQS